MVCRVHKDILFYALEYSLGRQTFAPLTTMGNIKENIEEFTDWELENIIHRIESHEQLHGNLGSESDKQDWYDFSNYINQQIYYRQGVNKNITKEIR